MSELPPIGSLWLHRESGERRFVTLHSRLGDNTYIGFNEVGLITYRLAAPKSGSRGPLTRIASTRRRRETFSAWRFHRSLPRVGRSASEVAVRLVRQVWTLAEHVCPRLRGERHQS